MKNPFKPSDWGLKGFFVLIRYYEYHYKTIVNPILCARCVFLELIK